VYKYEAHYETLVGESYDIEGTICCVPNV
jgi:hypothetical protein